MHLFLLPSFFLFSLQTIRISKNRTPFDSKTKVNKGTTIIDVTYFRGIHKKFVEIDKVCRFKVYRAELWVRRIVLLNYLYF